MSNPNLVAWRLLLERQPGQRLVFLAGIAVIAVGILCLFLSAEVAAAGSWWQSTLDAFGVGFVVGGVIDVLAIFGLNQFIGTEDQRRQRNNQWAQEILLPLPARGDPAEDAMARVERAMQALGLLSACGNMMDRQLLIQLADLVRAEASESADVQRFLKSLGLAHDDTPQPPGDR